MPPSREGIVGDMAAAHSIAIALAPCSFALPADAAAPTQIQLLPDGAFAPSDGRSLPVANWRIDAASAAQVIAAFAARKNPLVIDYEHQTLRKEENGQPAPAAGWMTALHWRDGQGLFATADFTARAASQIAAHEYLMRGEIFGGLRRDICRKRPEDQGRRRPVFATTLRVGKLQQGRLFDRSGAP